MSGAAAIAAAKNRRGRTETPKQVIDCNTLNGSCSIKPKNKNDQLPIQSNKSIQNPQIYENNIDPVTLKLTGPAPTNIILKIHEQRLNILSDKLSNGSNNAINETISTDDKRMVELEEKVKMLEDVIMNLQLTLTHLQSFSIETNLSVSKLQNEKSNNIVINESTLLDHSIIVPDTIDPTENEISSLIINTVNAVDEN